MASSHRLTCLIIEGNNLLKNKVSRLTLPSLLPMIRCSDGPKSYWGYYQTYLVQISGKKSKKKSPWFYSMAKKIGRNGDGGRRSNFGLKLNVQVQYNMLRPIWPAPIAITCLTIKGNNLLKNKVSRITLPSLLPMIRCSDGPKSYWGYYQTYLVQISGKKSKKHSPWFSAKNRKIHKGIVWRKKLAETATAGDVQILA